jgi:MATE family multidrug resistance protein
MTHPARPSLNESRSPLGEVVSLAWPTVLTMTSYTVMQFTDSLMVGQVSPLAVAAQGNGGIWAFAPISMGIGLLTVVNTFVAQNLGAGKLDEAPRYAWAGLWLSVVFSLVVLLPVAAVLPFLFSLMHDPSKIEAFDRLVELESGYGRILLVGGVLTISGRAMHQFFFGLHRPKVITLSAAIGNAVNIVVNYILIFGAAGLQVRNGAGEIMWSLPGVPGVPAMGLYGAAIGTIIGTAVELVIPLCVFLGPRMNAELNSRAAWRPNVGPMRDLLRLGWPAAIQYVNELICWAIFMTVLVGHFGQNHMTAGWIALKYMHLSFMPAVGFSVAVSSLVGRYIGAKDPDTAVARARLGTALAVGYMTVCGILFFALRHSLVGAFVGGDVTPEDAADIVRIGGHLLICAAVFQTVDALGILYSGALRGAGDTVWPGVMGMLYSWTFIVGFGWLIIVLWPSLQSIGPWIAASFFIIAFGLTMAWRFESGRWRSINLLDHGDAAGPSAESESAPTGE